MVGKATPDQGGPRKSPDGNPRPLVEHLREQERHNDGHNSGVKIGSLCSVSSILSHVTLEQPFRTLTNKARGKYNCKEVFLRLYPATFLPVSSTCVFLRASLLLSRYDTANEYITFTFWIKLLSPRTSRCSWHLTLVLSSTARVIHSHVIQISEFYTLKRVATDCGFEHIVNCTR